MDRYKVQLIGVITAVACSLLFYLHIRSSGYVLQLDMVFGPESEIAGWNSFKKEGSVYGLLIGLGSGLFTPQIFQKILLSAYVFMLFYIPYVSLYGIYRQVERKYVYAYMVGTLLFATNPFVYTRILSGQWNIVFGYALLPLVALYTHKVTESNRSIFGLVALLCALLFIAPHIFVVSIVSLTIFLVIQKRVWEVLQMWGIVSVLGSYVLYRGVTYMHVFSANTVSDFFRSPSVFEALTFSGFWLEHMSWSEMFLMPTRDLSFVHGCVSVLFVFGVVRGVWRVRKKSYFMATFCTGLIALLCTVYGSYVFGYTPILSHIFRDTSKWQVVVAVLSCFAYMHTYIHGSTKGRLLLSVVPLYFAMVTVAGVYTSLETYNYTENIYMVRGILEKEKSCKILVLPWHQYYTRYYKAQSGSVESVLTANPARHVYPCGVLQSLDGGMKEVKKNGVTDTVYERVDMFLRESAEYQMKEQDEFLQFLKESSFTHILYETPVLSEDMRRYDFLRGLQPVFQDTEDLRSGVVLYRL